MKKIHTVSRRLFAVITAAALSLSPMPSALPGQGTPLLMTARAEAISEQADGGMAMPDPVPGPAASSDDAALQPDPGGAGVPDTPVPETAPETEPPVDPAAAAPDSALPLSSEENTAVAEETQTVTPADPGAPPAPAAGETQVPLPDPSLSHEGETAAGPAAEDPAGVFPASSNESRAEVPAESITEDAEASGSEPDTEKITEALSEAESVTESETEAETETETESETETEKETEKEEESHTILFESREGVSISLHEDRFSYLAGEKVSFDVDTAEGYDLDTVSARSIQILSDEDISGTAGLGIDATGAGAAAGAMAVIEGDELPLTQTASSLVADTSGSDTPDSDTPNTDTFTFTMPDEDVILMASTVLAAPSSAPVTLEYGALHNIPPSWTPDGMEWAAGRITIGFSRYRTVEMPDGSKRVAYCIQPVLAADEEGDYTARRMTGSPLLQKALFYCFGGPGWNAGGIKNVLSDCSGVGEYYVASHFILSQIYVGRDGKWNKVVSNGVEYDAMNDRGVRQIDAAIAAISALPAPQADLSTTQVTGSYDRNSGFAVTQSVSYTSSIPGNTLHVTLPEGVYLVAGSSEYAPGQRAAIEPGTSFYLKKNGYSAGHTQTLTLTASVATDFAAYLINVSGGRQNMGFSYLADKTFTLQVNWPDLLTSLQVRKIDSLTGTSTPVNGNYSLDGAVYGIYEDAACTRLLEELAISGGQARSSENYVIGTTYYIREISAPERYQADPNVYPVTAEGNGQATVTSAETPKAFAVTVQKTDAETGVGAPQTSALSFAGARFGIYSDEACQARASDMNGALLPDLVTDENGSAATPCSLLIGDYWVKEIEPPIGYLLNQETFFVSSDASAAAAVSASPSVAMAAAEQIIRGNVSLMKIKNDKDQSIRPMAGIRFRLTYTADESVSFTVDESGPGLITTDGEGFATTESAAYPRGTLIYGEWQITEENPPEGYEPIEPMTVMVGADSRTYRYTANDRRIYASVLIEKRDANTGSLLPVPGVSFRILPVDSSKPIALFDPATRSEVSVWTTGADGMVQLPDTIPFGAYVLQEDPQTIPEGYLVMENAPFTVSGSSEDPLSPLVLTAQEPPQTGRITVRKTCAGTDEPLENFTFLIRAADDITDPTGAVRSGEDEAGQPCPLKAGTIVDRITTGEDGTAVSKVLFLGRYTVEEVAGAEGYAVSAEAQEVTLTADKTAALEGNGVQTSADFKNHPTTVQILKKSAAGGQPLAGVRFRISGPAADAGSDTESDTESGSEYITDASGQILIEKLAPGTYEVRETASLPGYNPDTEAVTFTVDEHGLIDGTWKKELVFTNTPNVLTISKQSITGGEEIPGAALTITDDSGNTVAEWISGDTPHVITAIPAGNYTLTEKLPAPGYTTAESIRFTVTDQSVVQSVTMKDDFTKVLISKSDMVTGEPVEGATLIITGPDGGEVARWVTTKEPYYIEKLPIGAYTLTEITAPKGYAVAESVSFEVLDHGEIQKVVMYDQPGDLPGNKNKKRKKEASVRTTPTGGSTPALSSAGQAPRTGDETNPGPALATALLSLLFIAGTLILRRKKRA